MILSNIRINNFKSLKKIYINFDNNINCFLGVNGSGKSTLLDALKYFYDMLGNGIIDKNIIDIRNPYIQKAQIELVYNLKDLKNNNKNEYIKDTIEILNKYKNEDNQILIRLTQFKDSTIKFYPNDKELLKIIHKIFPFYMVDTRFIKLQDWNIIWDIMSELSQTTMKLSNNEVAATLDDAFIEIYGEKYKKSLDKIINIFDKENINTNINDYNNRFKNSLMTRLGSSEFIQDENKLGYYSDGLNSYKYLKILLLLISELSDLSFKSPILIIDEPEIGLHHQYLKQIAKEISYNKYKKIDILISTHSSDLVDGLIKENLSYSIFRVYLENQYTKIEKMKEIFNEFDKDILSNNEVNCYFSDAVLFVEGLTEMQLFNNKNMKSLFKYLDKIYVYPYDSNNSKLRIINPSTLNFNIPYSILVDMDKILKINKKEYFVFNKDALVNPLSNEKINFKEKLLYYSSKDSKKLFTLYLREAINILIKKNKFELDKNLFYIKHDRFKELLKFIKIYCENYKILPVNTTIEGVIINKNSITKVIEWIKNEAVLNIEVLDELLQKYDNDLLYKTTIVRLICNGKFDNLKTMKETGNKILDNKTKSNIEILRSSIGNKTDGWLIKFINYYFENYINILEEKEKLETFKRDFPELFYVIQKIEDMV